MWRWFINVLWLFWMNRWRFKVKSVFASSTLHPAMLIFCITKAIGLVVFSQQIREKKIGMERVSTTFAFHFFQFPKSNTFFRTCIYHPLSHHSFYDFRFFRSLRLLSLFRLRSLSLSPSETQFLLLLLLLLMLNLLESLRIQPDSRYDCGTDTLDLGAIGFFGAVFFHMTKTRAFLFYDFMRSLYFDTF